LSIDHVITLDRALDRFLQEHIAIPTTARGSAATSQEYLREVLRNKASRDTSFPEVLTRKDQPFIGGSFQRHTKIWPLDDIDLFLPLDGGMLIYSSEGLRLPFTIATDSGSTRLDRQEWKTGHYIDSTKVLNGIETALSVTYPSSKVDIDKHCVKVQTTLAATSESEGIGFDVVPCFLLYPDDGSDSFYLVPNAAGGWMRSNPRNDTALNIELHEFHGPAYRKAVRLTKYWNKTQINDSFSSYYIELALSKEFKALKDQNVRFSLPSDAFARAMATLKSACTSGNIAPLIMEAPYVQAPNVTQDQRKYLEDDTSRARTAVNQAFVDGQPAAAFETMNQIFNTGFFV
jgi:hypothetical protein